MRYFIVLLLSMFLVISCSRSQRASSDAVDVVTEAGVGEAEVAEASLPADVPVMEASVC